VSAKWSVAANDSRNRASTSGSGSRSRSSSKKSGNRARRTRKSALQVATLKPELRNRRCWAIAADRIARIPWSTSIRPRWYDIGCTLLSQQGVLFIAGVLYEAGKLPGELLGEQREEDGLIEMAKKDAGIG